jgi:tripartite ATP-independent transporter DctP family solute receptor
MKNAVGLFLAIFLIAGGQFLFAGGGQEELGVPVVDEVPVVEPIVLQVGHIFPLSHVTHRSLEAMADFVEEETNGGLVLEIFPLGQLGQGANLSENVMLGTVDMATAGPGLLSNLEPSFGIWGAEYVFEDVDGLFAVVDSDVGAEIFERLRAGRGLRVIGVGYLGARHLTTTNTPVEFPADLQGLKIRIPPIPYRREAFIALGASPTPMAFAELYLGLQQGVVDGQENPLPQIISMKFYEVQDYLILTGHAQNPEMLIINDDRFESLPTDYQDVLVRAGHQVFGAMSRELSDQESAELLRQLVEDHGMTVMEPNLQAFRQAVAGVPEQFTDQWGEGIYERVMESQR